MAKQTYTLPILALVIASVLWGLNTPLIKLGTASIPIPIFISVRFMIASLVLLPFALRTWKPLRVRDFIRLILCSVLWITVSTVVFNAGLMRTSGIEASVLGLLSPLLLVVLSVGYLKERLSFKTFLGIMVALAGSFIILGRPWDGDGTLTGNLLVIIAVFGNVLSTVLFKPLLKKTSSYQGAFMALFPGTVPIALYALTTFGAWDIQATTKTSWIALVCSTFAILTANFLFFYALNHKKAQSTGVYIYIESTVAIAASCWLLSERFSFNFVLGAGLVFLGVYLSEMHKAKHHLYHHRARH